MPRVSFKAHLPRSKQSRRSPYIASRDYGTRDSEKRKQVIRFGRAKATLYRRSDIERSSWFIRIHLKEERRHYRKSLQTMDREEALIRAHDVVIDLLAKVSSGQRILALSLNDLVRRFSLFQEALVNSGQLASRTLAVQSYRVRLGCEFLKACYPAGTDTKITAIDGQIFNGYLKWRQEQVATKREQGTIRRDVVRDELLVIRKMFNYARKERLCTDKSIPVWDFVIEKEASRRRRITRANYKDFAYTTAAWVQDATSSPRDYYPRRMLAAIVTLAFRTGMRSGEIFGLRNKDVEIRGKNECLVTIRAETSKVRKERQITVASKMLVQWCTKYQRHREPENYVFSPWNSGATSSRDVFYHQYRLLRARLREIDLDWFDLYHCRHWYITTRLLAEESIYQIAQATGTSTSEIERTYSHVLTELTTKRFNQKTIAWDEDDKNYSVIQKLESV
jgi:integrase